MSDGDPADTRDDLETPFEVLPTQLHRSPPEQDLEGTGERLAPPAASVTPGGATPGSTTPGSTRPAWQEPEPSDEDKRTEFFDRDRLLRNRKAKLLEETPSIIVAETEKKPAAPGVDAVTDRHMRPAPIEAPKKKSRGPIVAVVGLICGLGGIAIGVSTAILMGDDGAEVAQTESPARLESSPIAPDDAAGDSGGGEEPAAEPSAEPSASPSTEPPSTEPPSTEPPSTEPPSSEATPSAPEPAAPVETPAMLVEQIQTALEEVDVDVAAQTLERARPLIEARIARRLEAQLMVLRGDGALAVERLTALTESYDEDPVLFIALGRVLAQAEQEQAAQRAFTRAVALDSGLADAHIGLGHIRARSFALGAARRHLRDAREAAEQGPSSNRLSARLKALEAAIELEDGDRDEATRLAREALELDSASAEASILMARVAVARGANPDRALRAALGGRAPSPVALGMLAARVEGAEACEMAERYLARAPRGYDAPAMRRISHRC